MKLKKLRKILKEKSKNISEEGVVGMAPTNSVAAHGTSIAGASPGEIPPVRKKRIPAFPKLKRNKPNM